MHTAFFFCALELTCKHSSAHNDRMAAVNHGTSNYDTTWCAQCDAHEIEIPQYLFKFLSALWFLFTKQLR
jgi:hypothetical protein